MGSLREAAEMTCVLPFFNDDKSQAEHSRLHLQVASPKASFNVLLTSYDFLMGKNDRPRLSKLKWEYIIVDEGHRLKNAGCKLNAEIKMYNTKSRLLLTGALSQVIAICCCLCCLPLVLSSDTPDCPHFRTPLLA